MYQKMRATITSQLITGVICVVDNCLQTGTMSVTNDAEAVVEYVVNKYGNYPIVYKDTEGRIDQLVHDNGKFIRFGALDETEFSRAVARILTNTA